MSFLSIDARLRRNTGIDFFARVGRIDVISLCSLFVLSVSLHFTHSHMNICCLAFFGQDPRCGSLAKSHTSRVEALSLNRPTCPEV